MKFEHVAKNNYIITDRGIIVGLLSGDSFGWHAQDACGRFIETFACTKKKAADKLVKKLRES